MRAPDANGQTAPPDPPPLGVPWSAAAPADIVEQHNRPTAPPTPPAHQRCALHERLNAPDALTGDRSKTVADVLSVLQRTPFRRPLSALRRECGAGDMSLVVCSGRVVGVAERFRLRPVAPLAPPLPITTEDLGMVCYQVAVPASEPSGG